MFEVMAKKRKKPTPLFVDIDPDLKEQLHRVKEREGISISAQVDRALRAWVAKRPKKLEEER